MQYPNKPSFHVATIFMPIYKRIVAVILTVSVMRCICYNDFVLLIKGQILRGRYQGQQRLYSECNHLFLPSTVKFNEIPVSFLYATRINNNESSVVHLMVQSFSTKIGCIIHQHLHQSSTQSFLLSNCSIQWKKISHKNLLQTCLYCRIFTYS